MIRLAVFDCDGTLVDGQAAICETMEEAFAAAGLVAPPRGAIRRMVGLSLPQALLRLAPDADADARARVVEAYKDGFRGRRTDGRVDEPLFDGIAETLTRLEDAGWLLAVATGKSDRGLVSCLEGHGIRQRFVSLQTADRHPSKPHPAMLQAALDDAGAMAEDSVMIGDTSFDIEMAVACGVRAVGVAWGYHEAQELRRAGAEAVAETPAELAELLA